MIRFILTFRCIHHNIFRDTVNKYVQPWIYTYKVTRINQLENSVKNNSYKWEKRKHAGDENKSKSKVNHETRKTEKK